MRRFRLGTVAVLYALMLMLGGCTLLGAATQGQVEDAAGTTEEEAMDMTLEEQYRLAGERYMELNERVAALQRDFFEDEWLDGSVSSEVIPRQGYVLGGALKGDDRENSYYFKATRWYNTDENLKPLLRKTAQAWESRGYNVAEEESPNGTIRIIATTEDGYWFAADEMDGQLELRSHTPVYWGERRQLSRATADRRDAENKDGAPWDTTDRDENGHAYRLPGIYRPYPAWDAA